MIKVTIISYWIFFFGQDFILLSCMKELDIFKCGCCDKVKLYRFCLDEEKALQVVLSSKTVFNCRSSKKQRRLQQKDSRLEKGNDI